MPKYIIFCYLPYDTEFCGGMNDFRGFIDNLENARPAAQNMTTTPEDYIWEIVEHESMRLVEKWQATKSYSIFGMKEQGTVWFQVT